MLVLYCLLVFRVCFLACLLHQNGLERLQGTVPRGEVPAPFLFYFFVFLCCFVFVCFFLFLPSPLSLFYVLFVCLCFLKKHILRIMRAAYSCFIYFLKNIIYVYVFLFIVVCTYFYLFIYRLVYQLSVYIYVWLYHFLELTGLIILIIVLFLL